MLDVVSGGRFIAGFPVGSSMDANFAYGQTPATLREKYREAHDLVIRAWTTPEPFTFNGKYTQLRYVNVWPRPIQKPHPPVWIPGGGSVETWEWVARQNYSYSFLSYFGFKPAIHNMQGYWETVERMGRDHNPFRAGFLQLVAISDSDASAEAEYADAASYFYHRCLHVPDHFFAAPGYMTLKSLKAIKTPFSFDTLKKLRWKDFVEEGYIIAGSPATVRERLTAVVRELNVGHLMLLLQFGSMGKELAKYNTKLFADAVLPKLRPLFAEWQDKWWPAPMAETERAAPAPFQAGAMAAE